VVSRAIFQHLANTEKDPTQATVFLDLSPIEPERIQRRFPNIIRRCLHWGVDIFQEPIPVAPAAHYWMGGITTDINCQTTIPGLYALGETASTGVHGANRLASNSLLECIVFASQLRNLSLPPVASNAPNVNQSTATEIQLDTTNDLTSLNHWRSELPRLMWQTAGICRQAETLQAAIAKLEQWQEEWQQLDSSKLLAHLPEDQKIILSGPGLDEFIQLWAETHNLLDIAQLILTSALFRQESRGGHYRVDYPDTKKEWQSHTVIEGTKVFLQPSQSRD
jgi:L-aspartate oxidase